MRLVTTFTVYGQAKPGGSKRAFQHPRTGQIVVTEDSKNKPWRSEVAGMGLAAMGGAPPLEGALRVRFTFFRPRPKGHYGKRGLRPSAPAHPITRPDVLKLARAVEDALTGVVWCDDSQIVDERIDKVFGEPERLEVTVTEL